VKPLERFGIAVISLWFLFALGIKTGYGTGYMIGDVRYWARCNATFRGNFLLNV
jgi:hypothetical protein